MEIVLAVEVVVFVVAFVVFVELVAVVLSVASDCSLLKVQVVDGDDVPNTAAVVHAGIFLPIQLVAVTDWLPIGIDIARWLVETIAAADLAVVVFVDCRYSMKLQEKEANNKIS